MTPQSPSELRLSKDRRTLTVTFGTAPSSFTAEFLRVYSPSAEVKGHGAGPRRIVPGKKNVTITALTPVGHYAVQLTFSDGHNTGIYTWEYLQSLSQSQFDLWGQYTDALTAQGLSRISATEKAS